MWPFSFLAAIPPVPSVPPNSVLAILGKIITDERTWHVCMGGFTAYILYRVLNTINPFHKPIDKRSRQLIEYARKKRQSRSIDLTNHEKYLAHNIVLPEQIGVSFEDIGGLEAVKDDIVQMIVLPFVRPDLFQNPLLSVPKGILLHGPPGTGKTMLAKAIAKQTEAVFINFNHAEINQAFFGESEKSLHALLSLAVKLQPSILFIDEADSVFAARGHYFSHELTLRLQLMLLQFIDGLLSTNNQVVVLACTNRPDSLDPAFLRRMQRRIEVGLPDLALRKKILELKLQRSLINPDVDFNRLAAITEGFSGSDLEMICKTAAQETLKRNARAAGQAVAQIEQIKVSMQDCLTAIQVNPRSPHHRLAQENRPQMNAQHLIPNRTPSNLTFNYIHLNVPPSFNGNAGAV